ncbi:Zn-ribbon domain-containing OB-fold protein [Rhodococcus qingshengii]|uniref:Zn-ribbon domain-containing OB-fold protein n=1 Tax=Rhodococcus qingshengii TaxID=334542 RepID=UPI00145605CE|nr:OB-fold domain-containing protein [Rhodococcus qingshengii]
MSLTSESLADRGTVYAVTVVHAHPDPTFMALAPYAVAMVDLDGGGRVTTRLTTPHADLVRIGDRVEVGAQPPAEEADHREDVDGQSPFLVDTIDGKQAH